MPLFNTRLCFDVTGLPHYALASSEEKKYHVVDLVLEGTPKEYEININKYFDQNSRQADLIAILPKPETEGAYLGVCKRRFSYQEQADYHHGVVIEFLENNEIFRWLYYSIFYGVAGFFIHSQVFKFIMENL